MKSRSPAGRPCTHRTVQRNCAKKHLDARLVPTTTGDRYLVARYSVSRHIAQLNEIASFTPQTTAHDMPRPNATEHDRTRHVATDRGGEVDSPKPEVRSPPTDALYVEQLERQNTFLRGERERPSQRSNSPRGVRRCARARVRRLNAPTMRARTIATLAG